MLQLWISVGILVDPFEGALGSLRLARSLATGHIGTVSQVHSRFSGLAEGTTLADVRIELHLTAVESRVVSSRFACVRATQHDLDEENRARPDNSIDLLLKVRDGFLSQTEIERIARDAASSDTLLRIVGFPERLSRNNPRTLFPLQPLIPPPVCLHVVHAVVADRISGAQLFATEQSTSWDTEEREARRPTSRSAAPRMLPAAEGSQLEERARTGNGRSSRQSNRDRGKKFIFWAVEAFGLQRLQADAGVLDVAGGSGQIAFELAFRRGISTTVVDPRDLCLSKEQLKTLEWHAASGLRTTPGGLRTSPLSDYDNHFPRSADEAASSEQQAASEQSACQETRSSVRDRKWLIAQSADGLADVSVRHMPLYFDREFVADPAWQKCSVVLGMHPDEATEAIVDLALEHDKPFAVVPCCVFWKLNPNRMTPAGKPVRSWEDFCAYLVAKDPARISVDTLPIHGRNLVLYYYPNDGRDLRNGAIAADRQVAVD